MAPGRLLQDKVALITGGGSGRSRPLNYYIACSLIYYHHPGYGEGIVKLFAEEGAKVLVADINEKAGQR